MKKASQKGFTLIELLVVIGILAVLLTAVLIAINPVRQFAQAKDSQRHNDVLAILNAVGQYSADNKGVLPLGIPVAPAAAVNVSAGGADLCSVLMPTYVSALPADPTANAGVPYSTCPVGYDTKYKIVQDGSGRVTVSATPDPNGTLAPITVTR